MKSKLTKAFYTVIGIIATHKITSAVILAITACVVAICIFLCNVFPTGVNKNSSSSKKLTAANSTVVTSSEKEVASTQSKLESTVSSNVQNTSSAVESTVTSIPSVSSTPSVPSVSSITTASSAPSVSSAPTTTSTPSVQTPTTPGVNPTANMTPDNNIFLDALEYTGYNLTAQRNSGRMWDSGSKYVLCSQKRGLGWLSNITYDDFGRSSGYETNANGLPDISYFEQKGLVCASYATYVYFNYLPNVAGIDTSMLAKPDKPVLANDWYIAAKKWVEAGYSRRINFTASDGGSIHNDLEIYPEEEIPIGSLILLCDWYNRSEWCSHICIYAGEMNGYHWVTHVGNENGPEFCAIERMNRKPHPQWPIAIITPPSNLNWGN